MLTPMGLWRAVRTLRICRREKVPLGWLYVLAVVIVGMTYYLPTSQLESVDFGRGGKQWTYPDTATHEAWATLLTVPKPPAGNPGFSAAGLTYHYGRHALASMISQFFLIDIGDSMWRIVFMFGLASLFAAAICLGWKTASSADQRPLSGLLAVLMIFLIPSLLMVLMEEGDSCSRNPHAVAILPGLPYEISLGTCDMAVVSHLQEGGSILWAGIVVVTIACLLLRADCDTTPSDQPGLPWLAALLAGLGLSLNGVAALSSTAVIVILVLAQRGKIHRRVGFVLVVLLFFKVCQYAAGLLHPNGTALSSDPRNFVMTAVRLGVAAFFFLFGAKSLSLLVFAWGSLRTRMLMALYLLASFGLFVFFNLQGYPLFILAVLLSGFAASPAARLWQSLWAERASWTDNWLTALRVYRNYLLAMLLLATLFIPFAWYPSLRRGTLRPVYDFSILILIMWFGSAVLLAVVRRLLWKTWAPSPNAGIVAISLLMAWSMSGVALAVVEHVFDLTGSAVTVDAGRTTSLAFLKQNSGPEILVGTTFPPAALPPATKTVRRGQSESYAAVLGRYMPFEGWQMAYALSTDQVEKIRSDKEELLSTRDMATAREIIEKYGITHVLLEPKQSFGFAIDKAPWLTTMKNPGTLQILKVDLKQAGQDPGLHPKSASTAE